jgi:hypothetical protein
MLLLNKECRRMLILSYVQMRITLARCKRGEGREDYVAVVDSAFS